MHVPQLNILCLFNTGSNKKNDNIYMGIYVNYVINMILKI